MNPVIKGAGIAYGWPEEIPEEPHGASTRLPICSSRGSRALARRPAARGRALRLGDYRGRARVSYISSVPTAEERGVIQGVSVSWWAGISMPAATPDAVVKKREGALAAEMTAFVEKQAAYYTDMAGKIGIRK